MEPLARLQRANGRVQGFNALGFIVHDARMIRLMPSHTVLGSASGSFQRARVSEGSNTHSIHDIFDLIHGNICAPIAPWNVCGT